MLDWTEQGVRPAGPELVTTLAMLVSWIVASAIVTATPAHAQTGTVAGRVAEAETGRPVAEVTIEVLPSATGRSGRTLATDVRGNFRVQLAAGEHSFLVSRLGYETQRIDGVQVRTGESTQLVISLGYRALLMRPVVIAAARRNRSGALAATSSTTVVGRERLRERIAVTAADHVRAVPGMDVAETGIQQSSVVARGFNRVGSSSLMTIVDGRYANLPSLRLSGLSFLPTADLDLERIEVVRGPASALYGPNAANGVVHLVTASPIDRQGTSVSVAAGERSVLHAQFRHALALWSRAGLKISGGFFRGEDWHYRDPFEEAARANALADGAREDTLRTGRRDFDARRLSADVRLDVRPSDDSEITLSAGATNVPSMIELMEVGAVQADGWTHGYVQARYRRGDWFAQAFVNRSSTGETYLLRTGEPFVDRSWMFAGQLRHGFDLGRRASFLYGVDVQRTEPRTNGTITGRNEDDDTVDEIGGYVHSEVRLGNALDLVTAVRVDHHNRLERPNVSPRVALVWRPADAQTFRLSFNGAFTTPTTNHLFLDALTSRADVAPGLGFDVRARGVPAGGFTFHDRCEGGGPFYRLCMWTPFAPGQKVSTNGALIWNDVVDLIVPDELRSALYLPGNPFREPDPALGTRTYRLDEDVGEFVLATGNEIDPIRPTHTRTIELGYVGTISDRLTVSVDLHYNWVKDYIGPLRVETPTVRYTAESVRAFLEHRKKWESALDDVSSEEFDALVETFSTLPIGIVVPDQLDAAEMMLTYRNTADFEIWGAELAAQLLVDERISLAGNFSHMSANCFSPMAGEGGTCSDLLDIALNAPRNKGAVSVRWDDVRRGLVLEARARVSSGFSMNSRPFVGVVDGYTLFDATASYRTALLPDATLTLSATNVLDQRTRFFLGAPEVGRLVMIRLGYEL